MGKILQKQGVRAGCCPVLNFAFRVRGLNIGSRKITGLWRSPCRQARFQAGFREGRRHRDRNASQRHLGNDEDAEFARMRYRVGSRRSG